MSVANMKIDESVLFEPNRLADLYHRLGEIGAENILCDAMEDLTIQLVRIEKLARRGRRDEVAAIAGKIMPVAGRIGLQGLARGRRGCGALCAERRCGGLCRDRGAAVADRRQIPDRALGSAGALGLSAATGAIATFPADPAGACGAGIGQSPEPA